MPARTIDTAYVEIKPDLSELDDLPRQVTRILNRVVRGADQSGDDIDEAFHKTADDIAREFDIMARYVGAQFDEVARSADDAADDVARDMQFAGERTEDAFQEASRVARHEMDEIERKATTTAASTSAKFKGIGLAAAAGLAVASAAVVAGLGAVTAFGLMSAAQFEQTQISFNALLGSVEAGQKAFDDLQAFAAKTPFEFQDVAAAAKRFFAFNQTVGMSDDQVVDFLTTLGDLASVTGAGAEGLNRVALAISQIASKGKTSLEEVMQIGEAVPGFSAIGAIAQSLGITTAQAMEEISKGSIDAETGINALLQGMKEFPGAAGAMEAQSQTLLGVFSTFKDTVSLTLADAFAPAIPAIKESLTEITPIIGEAVGQLGPALGEALSTALPLLADLLSGIVPILTPIIDIFTSALDSLGPVIAPLGEVLGKVVEAFAPLGPIIGEILTTAIESLLPVIIALTPVFEELVPPLGDILLALLPLIPPLTRLIVLALRILQPFIDLTAIIVDFGTAEIVVPIIDKIVKGLTDLERPLEAVATWFQAIDWAEVGQDIVQWFNAAGNAVSEAWDTLTSGPAEAIQNVREFKDDVIEAFGRIADGIKGVFKGAFNAIAGFWNRTVGSLSWTAPSWVPGNISVNVPDIPTLAHGGVAFGPAIIGEDPGTSPEVALPLGDPRAMSLLVDAIERAGGTAQQQNNTTVIVEIDGQQLEGRIKRVVSQRDRDTVRRVLTRKPGVA